MNIFQKLFSVYLNNFYIPNYSYIKTVLFFTEVLWAKDNDTTAKIKIE